MEQKQQFNNNNNKFNNNRGGYKNNKVKPGDWNCVECDKLNFAKREKCMECDAPKGDAKIIKTFGNDFKTGDWSCSACEAHNFAKRNDCFKCGEQKKEEDVVNTVSSKIQNYKDDDWICSCKAHNFAKRTECYKCGIAKGEDVKVLQGNNNSSKPFQNNNRQQNNNGNKQNNFKGDDWSCPECNCTNFARRTKCYDCQAPKNATDEQEQQSKNEFQNNNRNRNRNQGTQKPRSDGWNCQDCNAYNFAQRTECFKCHQAKN